jgi:hypothetical protein
MRALLTDVMERGVSRIGVLSRLLVVPPSER